MFIFVFVFTFILNDSWVAFSIPKTVEETREDFAGSLDESEGDRVRLNRESAVLGSLVGEGACQQVLVQE